jgi:hypothetical protein
MGDAIIDGGATPGRGGMADRREQEAERKLEEHARRHRGCRAHPARHGLPPLLERRHRRPDGRKVSVERTGGQVLRNVEADADQRDDGHAQGAGPHRPDGSSRWAQGQRPKARCEEGESRPDDRLAGRAPMAEEEQLDDRADEPESDESDQGPSE